MTWLADPRTWVTVLYAIGGALPVWGVIGAYRHTITSIQDLEAKVERGRELIALQDAERDSLRAQGRRDEENDVIEKYRRIREQEGIPATTWDGLAHIELSSQAMMWRSTLGRVRGDLIWVGVGVAAAAAASVWSTWI